MPHGMPGRWDHLVRQLQSWMPYDLEESDTEYFITIPLPGFDVKDINVSVKDKEILIEATKPKEEKKDNDEKTKKIYNWGDYIWNRNIELSPKMVSHCIVFFHF